MSSEKKKQNEWIKLKKGSWIGLDYDHKGNPLIDWKDILKLKSDDDTIGYDFQVVAYRKVKVSDEQREAININYIGSCSSVRLSMV